jgi:hypothetical protein
MEQTYKNEKFFFFWNGFFSNWHESKFVVDGIEFNCGEQFFMYKKALTFDDVETANKVLKELSPRRQKALGREIKNYNDEAWNSVKFNVVKSGLREKFNQNAIFKAYLLKYKGYTLVEASPEDNVWGIGFDEDEAIANIDNWGQNLLGKILTELSNEL